MAPKSKRSCREFWHHVAAAAADRVAKVGPTAAQMPGAAAAAWPRRPKWWVVATATRG